MSNNIQFRRGTKTDYDALVTSASGIDNHDIYIIGGTTVNDKENPLRMYIGNEPVQSVLSNDIPVTVDLGAGIRQNSVITAGTPIETILKTLLCQERKPASASVPKLNVTVSGNAPASLQYVGSTVTINKFTMYESNGVFNNNGWTTPTQPQPVYSGTLTYNMSTTGFSGYVLETESKGEVYKMSPTTTSFTTNIPAQSNIVVGSGLNKVTITGTFNYNAPENYPITNLSTECTSTGSWSSGATSGTTSISITGVRPTYTNGTQLTTSTQYGKDTFTHGTTSTTMNIMDTYTKGTTGVITIGFGALDQSNGVYVELPSNITLVTGKTYKDDEKAHLNVVTLVSSAGRTENNIQYTKWTYSEKRGAGTMQFFTTNTTTGA
jgi:hypothetical protein